MHQNLGLVKVVLLRIIKTLGESVLRSGSSSLMGAVKVTCSVLRINADNGPDIQVYLSFSWALGFKPLPVKAEWDRLLLLHLKCTLYW